MPPPVGTPTGLSTPRRRRRSPGPQPLAGGEQAEGSGAPRGVPSEAVRPQAPAPGSGWRRRRGDGARRAGLLQAPRCFSSFAQDSRKEQSSLPGSGSRPAAPAPCAPRAASLSPRGAGKGRRLLSSEIPFRGLAGSADRGGFDVCAAPGTRARGVWVGPARWCGARSRVTGRRRAAPHLRGGGHARSGPQ